MSITPRKKIEYPTSDGKPMAETETHMRVMIDLNQTLNDHFAERGDVCVSGNMLMFYEEGNRRRHLSPDVFVVLGVPRRVRDNYLIWEEGKGPDLVFEITSKSTRREDTVGKKELYRDRLGVEEYILFDPFGDYLRPRLQGFRLEAGEYLPIEPVDGRLPSRVTGLHFEARAQELRPFDPTRGAMLLTTREQVRESESARRQADEARLDAEAARRNSDETRLVAEAEVARLRAEIEAMRRGGGGSG